MTQLEAVKRELLSHYVSMCAVSDDWKRQAWRSANDLAERFPSEFRDLPELLTTAMKGKNDAA